MRAKLAGHVQAAQNLTKHSVLVVGFFQLFQTLAQHVPQLIQTKLLTEQRKIWRTLFFLFLTLLGPFQHCGNKEV